MGRKVFTWQVLEDKKANSFLIYNQDQGPHIRRTRGRYQDIGAFHDKERAEQLKGFLELGILPDGIAFLECEHEVLEMMRTRSDDDLGETFLQELNELTEKVRKDTGRNCFGGCRSLGREKACETCYDAARETWALCAYIKCVLEEYRAQHRPSEFSPDKAKQRKDETVD